MAKKDYQLVEKVYWLEGVYDDGTKHNTGDFDIYRMSYGTEQNAIEAAGRWTMDKCYNVETAIIHKPTKKKIWERVYA